MSQRSQVIKVPVLVSQLVRRSVVVLNSSGHFSHHSDQMSQRSQVSRVTLQGLFSLSKHVLGSVSLFDKVRYRAA